MSDTAWMTKQEAATALGVSEKTIDRMSERGEITRQTDRVPGKSPIPVFNREDVNRLREKKGLSDSGGQEVVKAADQMQQFGAAVVHAIRQSVQPEPEPEKDEGLSLSELRFKIYLTTAEAVRYTGLSDDLLKQLTGDGQVKRLGKNRYRYRRADLDKL